MSVPTAIVQGLALGFEMYKLFAMEQSVQKLAAEAGMSPEALDAALAKKRIEFKASRDPNTLAEG
jgi:hypothetical protein